MGHLFLENTIMTSNSEFCPTIKFIIPFTVKHPQKFQNLFLYKKHLFFAKTYSYAYKLIGCEF